MVWSAGGTKGFDSVGQGMDGGWIGHGLAILGACAKNAGHEVNLLDRRALKGWEHYREELARRTPDVVGFTMLSVDFNAVMRGIELAKQVKPDAITVVGGPHPTVAPEEVLANPQVDYVITGEGEISFIELLHKLEHGQESPRVIPGIHPELDELPFPDRGLYLDEWRRMGYEVNSPEVPVVPELPPPFVTIIAGRGCRYNCSFCKPGEDLLFGKRVRRRSIPNVIAELELLRERYAFQSMMLHDDTLTEDREWVRKFCLSYRKAGFTEPFFCQTRADHVVRDEEMVKLMAEAGLRGFFIGFESGSERILRFIRKGTTVAQNLEAARICHKYGILIWANYMLGLPTETEEEIWQTVQMMKRIDPDYYSPAFYTPYPGNDLYDYCMEHDLSLITDHDGYARNPTEPKIKGHDPDFLMRALAASQERTLLNRVRRTSRWLWRHASPRKTWRKLRRMAAGSRSAT